MGYVHFCLLVVLFVNFQAATFEEAACDVNKGEMENECGEDEWSPLTCKDSFVHLCYRGVCTCTNGGFCEKQTEDQRRECQEYCKTNFKKLWIGFCNDNGGCTCMNGKDVCKLKLCDKACKVRDNGSEIGKCSKDHESCFCDLDI